MDLLLEQLLKAYEAISDLDGLMEELSETNPELHQKLNNLILQKQGSVYGLSLNFEYAINELKEA